MTMFRSLLSDAFRMRRTAFALSRRARRAAPSAARRPRHAWLIVPLVAAGCADESRHGPMATSGSSTSTRSPAARANCRVCPCQPSSPTASRWNGPSCRASRSRRASPPRSAGVAARWSSAWRCRPTPPIPRRRSTRNSSSSCRTAPPRSTSTARRRRWRKDQAIYLQPGAVRSMKAGANGLRAFEIYSPVRLDHLALAGQNTSGVSVDLSGSGRDAVAPAGSRRRRATTSSGRR